MSISPHAPPHSEEAEQAVLGACLLDLDAYQMLAALGQQDVPESGNGKSLAPPWIQVFHLQRHRSIAAAMARLHRRGVEINLLTLADELRDEIEAAGGRGYLASLPQAVVSATGLPFHWERLVERYHARVAIGCCRDFFDAIESKQEVAEDAVQDLIHGLRSCQRRNQRLRTLDLDREEGKELVDRLLRETTDHTVHDLNTGIVALDQHLGRLVPGKPYLIQGFSGLGKTQLSIGIVLNIAQQLAREDSLGRIAFCSREDDERDILRRLTTSICCVDKEVWKNTPYPNHAKKALRHIRDHVIPKLPLTLIDMSTGGKPTLDQIHHLLRERLSQENHYRIIVLDYAQCLRTGNPKVDGSDYNLHSEIMDWIYDVLIEEFGATVLIISQDDPNEYEQQKRRGQRGGPMKSRGGYTLFQRSYAAMRLERPAYHDPEEYKGAWIQPARLVIFEKRGCTAGKIELDHSPHYGLFADAGSLATIINHQRKYWEHGDSGQGEMDLTQTSTPKSPPAEDEGDDDLPF